MDKYAKIYSALIILTIFTYLIGYLKLTSIILIGILLFTTFIKGYLVIEYFMQLNNVKGKYRFIPTIWLGIIIISIAFGYYL